jgi:glycosyltransferase involved in cell wall biosynthesis
VVGDGCTDESRDVALSFDDGRVRWLNLETNHGNQYAANNFGLREARGEFIAYLGHDDLWWPTHLESAVSVAREKNADVVASVAILYGPAESRIRAVTGLFPGEEFNPRYFFSTSATLHRRSLVDRSGGWRSPQEALGAADFDFLHRLYQTGATFATTRELTVFQFIASWRRNSYVDRSVIEQTKLLRRFDEEKETFRHNELVSVLQAVIEDRFLPTETPPDKAGPASENTLFWQTFKGSRRRNAPLLSLTESGVRFFVEEPYVGFEWHPAETSGGLRWRWTGPSSRSSFYLPVGIDRPCELRISVLHTLREAELADATLWAGDRQLAAQWHAQGDGTWIWSATLDPATREGEPIDLITIQVPRPRRPIDLGINEDRRWLGLSIGSIELIPPNVLHSG